MECEDITKAADPSRVFTIVDKNDFKKPGNKAHVISIKMPFNFGSADAVYEVQIKLLK